MAWWKLIAGENWEDKVLRCKGAARGSGDILLLDCLTGEIMRRVGLI